MRDWRALRRQSCQTLVSLDDLPPGNLLSVHLCSPLAVQIAAHPSVEAVTKWTIHLWSKDVEGDQGTKRGAVPLTQRANAFLAWRAGRLQAPLVKPADHVRRRVAHGGRCIPWRSEERY